MAEKAPNYSDADVAILRERYGAVREESEEVRSNVVNELAAELGKKRGSIIAKLSNMDIYVAKVKVSKVTGGEAIKKVDLAKRMVELIESQVDYAEKQPRLNFETLAKANKTDLSGIERAFQVMAARIHRLENPVEPDAAEVETAEA